MAACLAVLTAVALIVLAWAIQPRDRDDAALGWLGAVLVGLAALVLAATGCLGAEATARSGRSAGESARADLAFERAIEESAAILSGARPPEPWRSIFAAMGSDRYAEREAASEAAMARPDARFLWWGRMSRDLEVRHRCHAAIKRLHPCVTCSATGRSKNWDAWPCFDCQGTASVMLGCTPWD